MAQEDEGFSTDTRSPRRSFIKEKGNIFLWLIPSFVVFTLDSLKRTYKYKNSRGGGGTAATAAACR